MTTDYKSATDYRGSPGFDDAMADARLAGDGGTIDGFVERMAERIGGKASVRAVFGEPIERDGITVIPVAKVRWGFGGGAGRGPIAMGPGIEGRAAPEAPMSGDPSQSGAGSGAGGGVTADPIGYLEIGPDGANFRPITPVMPSPGFLLAAGITAMLVLRGLAGLIRR
jgi:uncharacterized spore protein YtfJ